MNAHCIDFFRNGYAVPRDQVEVMEYDPEDLEFELREFGVNAPEELSDWDRMVFSDVLEAEDFLSDYDLTLRLLQQGKYPCVSRELPNISFRRHMLVMTLMRAKPMVTEQYVRKYRNIINSMKPGDLFNLQDRVNFVTFEWVGVEVKGDIAWISFKHIRS